MFTMRISDCGLRIWRTMAKTALAIALPLCLAGCDKPTAPVAKAAPTPPPAVAATTNTGGAPPGPTTRPGPPDPSAKLVPTSRPADSPGHYRLIHECNIAGQTMSRPYMLYLPEGYDAKADKTWPVIVFLHGGWESGTDWNLLTIHGPSRQVEWYPEFRKGFGFIVLTPQAIYDKTFADDDMAGFALDLLEQTSKRLRVDRSRIYLTGLSWGGAGCWRLAGDHPEKFAAIAPLCSKAVDNQKAVAAAKTTPVFMAVGGNDDAPYIEAAKSLSQSIREAGATVEFRLIPDKPHDIWTDLYAGRELYDWFLKYSKPQRP